MGKIRGSTFPDRRVSPLAGPLRIEYPGTLYHITSRGNEKKEIFRSIKDRNEAQRNRGTLRDIRIGGKSCLLEV